MVEKEAEKAIEYLERKGFLLFDIDFSQDMVNQCTGTDYIFVHFERKIIFSWKLGWDIAYIFGYLEDYEEQKFYKLISSGIERQVNENQLELIKEIDTVKPEQIVDLPCGCTVNANGDFSECIHNSWADSRSVGCIDCGIIFDEREGYTPDDGEGTLCPHCTEIREKRPETFIEFPKDALPDGEVERDG